MSQEDDAKGTNTPQFMASMSAMAMFHYLVELHCPSAHSPCEPLTFDIHGEIINVSSAEQALPAKLTLFSPS
jgi:hypothetical protein